MLTLPCHFACSSLAPLLGRQGFQGPCGCSCCCPSVARLLCCCRPARSSLTPSLVSSRILEALLLRYGYAGLLCCFGQLARSSLAPSLCSKGGWEALLLQQLLPLITLGASAASCAAEFPRGTAGAATRRDQPDTSPAPRSLPRFALEGFCHTCSCSNRCPSVALFFFTSFATSPVPRSPPRLAPLGFHGPCGYSCYCPSVTLGSSVDAAAPPAPRSLPR